MSLSEENELLRITQYGEPILRRKSAPVGAFTPDLLTLSKRMLSTMYHAEGIGLAAQQVDCTAAICVVDIGEATAETGPTVLDGKTIPAELLMPLVLVNPVWQEAGGDIISWEEGCLSIEGIRAEVERPETIEVRYQDIQGHAHQLHCQGLLARCIQHEIDHLQGVLFIDRLTPRQKNRLRARLKKLKENTSFTTEEAESAEQRGNAI